MSAPDKIYGEGKPGARPCIWPDEEAPYDWDDPAICRRPATCLVRFKGSQQGVPSCDDCAGKVLADAKANAVREPLEKNA